MTARSESRQRTSLIVFRVLPEEAEVIQEQAARQGLTVSAYVRARVLWRPPGGSSRP